MLLKYFYDKSLAHAAYMVGCQRANVAVIVDPGRDIDQYLDMAQATDPGSSTAIRLTQAELLIDSGQYDRATAALLRIRQEDSRNSRALLLMSKLFT